MKSDSTRTTRTRELPRTTQLPWLSVRFMRNPIVSVHDVSCGYYTRDQPAKFLSRLAASFKTIKIDSRDLAARNVLVGEREKGVKWQTLGWPEMSSKKISMNERRRLSNNLYEYYINYQRLWFVPFYKFGPVSQSMFEIFRVAFQWSGQLMRRCCMEDIPPKVMCKYIITHSNEF